MSWNWTWCRDPQLFICSSSGIFRITKEFGTSPIVISDFKDRKELILSNHLASLGLEDHNQIDYPAFKATLNPKYGVFKFINCQGSVIIWDSDKATGTWAREEPNSIFWSLPGINTKPKSVTEEALEDKVSELEAKNLSLRDEINNNKVEYEKTVSSLKEEIKKIEKAKQNLAAEISSLEKEKEALEAEISSLKEKSKRVEKEKGAIEAENIVIKAEVKRERDEKIALIDAFKRDDMLARFEALQKQVSDLPSKLVQSDGGGSSIEEPWVTVDTA